MNKISLMLGYGFAKSPNSTKYQIAIIM